MSYLTLVAKVEAGQAEERVLLDAMYCATKVWNGLIWHLRQEYEQTGKTNLSLKHLERLIDDLPRAKGYFSLSVQATRNEVRWAYKSFFSLRKAGYVRASMPGYRRKNSYSGLRYFDGYGFKIEGDRLTISLGTRRMDGVQHVTVRFQHRPDVVYRKVVSVILTYDKKNGIEAHLVIDVEDGKAKGSRKVAVDLGETQAISAIFDNGQAFLYNGRKIKAVRRYWQKVRSKVKPPTEENQNKSKRYRQIERKEYRQVCHLLHILTKDFVERCYLAGVDTIAIGDLTGIRQKIDYGKTVNQHLHAWPFAKVTAMIEYKARLHGIQVIKVDEAYSSQTCHGCHKIARPNRKTRGQYQCSCGWQAHADINSAANLFQTAFQVSPFIRSSGDVTSPAVVSLQFERHMVCKA